MAKKIKKIRNSKTRVEPKQKPRLNKTKDNVQFSDIIYVSRFNLSTIIKKVDLTTLATALIGVDDDIKDVILSNMAKRNLIKFEEIQLDYSSIMQSDIINARKALLAGMKEVIFDK